MAQSSEGARTAALGRGVTEIHEHETGRRYKVIDLNNEVIEQTAKEIVQASKLLNNQGLWIANFQAMIGQVRGWCDEHAAQIKIALVDIRSTKVLFYFVPESERYDLALGDAMTDLEVELGMSIGHIETLQVPCGSLERFAGPRSFSIWERGTGSGA